MIAHGQLSHKMFGLVVQSIKNLKVAKWLSIYEHLLLYIKLPETNQCIIPFVIEQLYIRCML